jgi:hypothetical protein
MLLVNKETLVAFGISFLISFYLIVQFGLDAISITLLCGFLAAGLLLGDVVKVATGKTDLFNPSVVVAFIGVFFFLISPVSQVHWNFWPYLPSMSNDHGWIDLWSLINLIGVIIYVYTKEKAFKKNLPNKIQQKTVDKNKFFYISVIFLSITFIAQVYIYISFGGIQGFINTFTLRQELGRDGDDPFQGMGMIMLLAESFKLIFAMFIIFLVKERGGCKSNQCFLLLMLMFLFVFIFFGGLRGSRSSTLLPLIFAAGMYHYWIRPIPFKMVMYGLFGIFLFLTSYYWYKIAGVDGINAIFDSSQRTEFHESRQNADMYIISRDLGRMDFQSLALKRIYDEDFPLSYGRTYLTSIFSVVPKAIVPFKPDSITKEKTELLHGIGSYDSNGWRQTTLVLGQYGEALVNFGIAGVFAFYFLLGRLVFYLNYLVKALENSDVRKLLLPVFTFIPVWLLITDMNVVIYQLFRYLTIPLIMVWLVFKLSPQRRSL